MIEILKIRYDDIGYWYSSKKRLKDILLDPYLPEMLIIHLDEINEMIFCLLTDLQGKDVLVGTEVIKIPDINVLLQ